MNRVPPGESRSDEELVRDARHGDVRAFDMLVERHHAGVFRVALSILGDGDDAADATQETFLKAVRGLERFRGDASFRTWLMTIAANAARGIFRKRGRRRELPIEDAGEIRQEDDGLDEAAFGKEVDRVRRFLQNLPEKQRLAVQLRTQEGLSFREIGAIIGSSEGAARVNYHHGIKRLRGMLE